MLSVRSSELVESILRSRFQPNSLGAAPFLNNLASNPEPIRQLLAGRRGIDAWTKTDLFEQGIHPLFESFPSFGEPIGFDYALAIDFLISVGELMEVPQESELDNARNTIELAAPGFILESGHTRTCLLIGEFSIQALSQFRQYGEIEYRSTLRRFQLHAEGELKSVEEALALLEFPLAEYPAPVVAAHQDAADVVEAIELELKSQRWVVANDQVDVDFVLARLTAGTRRNWSKRKKQRDDSAVSDGIFVAQIFKNNRRFTSWVLLDISNSIVRHSMDFYGNGGFSQAMRIDSALNAVAGVPNVLDVVLTNNKQTAGDSGIARIGLYFPAPTDVKFQLLYLGRTSSTKLSGTFATYEIETQKIQTVNEVMGQLCWTEWEIGNDD
jgi:hypothetical protein